MNYFVTLAAVLFIYMRVWFVIALLKKRNDVADVAWGLGFVLLAWVSYFLARDPGIRGLLVCIMVSIWGFRLAWHIHTRNRGKVEDYRYGAWRKEWGKWFYLRSYFQVYLLQGTLLFLVAFPVLLINKSTGTALGVSDIFGFGMWIIGFFFETVGDAQLASFIKNPSNKGKIMQGGLWAYTRHPNYFGEVTQWWGLWMIGLSVPGGWLGIIGPITITLLILKVSGIPMLEKRMQENPDFAEYKRRVSMLIPLPPRVIPRR